VLASDVFALRSPTRTPKTPRRSRRKGFSILASKQQNRFRPLLNVKLGGYVCWDEAMQSEYRKNGKIEVSLKPGPAEKLCRKLNRESEPVLPMFVK